MEVATAAKAFSALGHQPRLEVFRLLVQAGPDGMAAGDIARATNTVQNTLSSHLNILSAAGLITARRDGRSIIYSAAFGPIGDLLGFVVEDCCGGDPGICGPALESVTKAASGS